MINGLEIRLKRKQLNLTQKDLAKMLGVSGNTIINWERGETIPQSKYIILYNFLNLSDNPKDAEIVPLIEKQQKLEINDGEIIKTSTIGSRLLYAIQKKDSNANKISLGTTIHPSTIKNYILNKGKPDYIRLYKIAEFLRISKDWLKEGVGEMNIENNSISNVKEIEFNESMEVEYLPVQAQAGYLDGLVVNRPVELKKILVPKELEKGFYKVIEIQGDSMNDGTTRSICDGDKLLLKEIEGGNYLKKPFPYRNNLFVIVSGHGIVCKQIISHNIKKKCFVCHSFNPLHEDYEISFEDIYQLFYAKQLIYRKIKF